MLDFFCFIFSFNLLTALLVSDAGRSCGDMRGQCWFFSRIWGFGVSLLRAGPCESLGQHQES